MSIRTYFVLKNYFYPMYLKNFIVFICTTCMLSGCVIQDMIPRNSQGSSTISDVEIERKKYEIDNISIVQ